MKRRRDREPTGLSLTVLPLVSIAIALGLVLLFAVRLSGEASEAETELENLVPLVAAVVFFAVVSVIILVYTGMSHARRMTGPIHRITSSLRTVAAGERGLRIQVRQDDYLAEVVQEINNVLDSLEDSTEELPRKPRLADQPQPVR